MINNFHLLTIKIKQQQYIFNLYLIFFLLSSMPSCNNSSFNFFKFINWSKRLLRSDRACRISETNSPKIWLVSLCKHVVSSASFSTASIVLFLPRLGSGGGFRIGVEDGGTTGLATGLGSGR
jgi:hypothetical protein